MNTIDWEELLDDVTKDIEDENTEITPDGELKSCCRGTSGCPQCVSDFEENS